MQEFTKSHPEVFTVDNACEKWTLSLKWKWSRNSIDLESSDAAKLKQLRDQMVQTHRESPRSTTQTEPEQTATECYQTVRCQSDHDNVEHNVGQDCTELFADFSIFCAILMVKFRSVQWIFLGLYTLVESEEYAARHFFWFFLLVGPANPSEVGVHFFGMFLQL